ncbi:hypothetical protein LSH36_331g01035 [Paralvinella palmiformis]|uniref:Nucleotide-diphospho-sugar transferase domain-containing protein n=1 Tax=Paralvinella palmiformis TaxID=53620 RepID=A0AAD9JFT9_9ANNE|nr:hypothetical protein LSH36_331g01035 [Paralvinella palmiformis]
MAHFHYLCRHRRNAIKTTTLFLVLVTALTATVELLRQTIIEELTREAANGIYSDYIGALRNAFRSNETVILVPFDSGFLDMTANFYISSIKKHGIREVLFIALDREACSGLAESLRPDHPNCVSYAAEPSSERAATWGTAEFRRKNMMKRQLILYALRARYNVLMTDVDMVFVENPLPDLRDSCKAVNCDLAIQWDLKHSNFNGGFIYARRTSVTRWIYERQLEYDQNADRVMNTEQQQLNVAIEEIRSEHNSSVTVIPMNTTKYPVGKPFFHKRRCPPSGRLDGVVALHNNYLRENNNKIFRLKECALWEYDGPDGYYTDANRRYLSYQYNLRNGKKEYQGLLNAFLIGQVLNRTVILPNSFYREGDLQTNLLLRVYQRLDMYFIQDFNRCTRGNYRESSFLNNSFVPAEVRNSKSDLYHIITGSKDDFWINGSEVRLLRARDIEKGPTVGEIQTWFQRVRQSVLQFDTLYGNFQQLPYETYLGAQFMELVRPLDGPLKFHKYITEGKLQAKLRNGKKVYSAYVTKDT